MRLVITDQAGLANAAAILCQIGEDDIERPVTLASQSLASTGKKMYKLTKKHWLYYKEILLVYIILDKDFSYCLTTSHCNTLLVKISLFLHGMTE